MSSRDESESLATTLQDLKTLVVGYVRQETLDPIKDLGRFLGLGLAGVVIGGVGGLFLILGGIRALQAETGSTFTGNLSFLPYLFALILCAIVAGLALRAVAGGDDRRAR